MPKPLADIEAQVDDIVDRVAVGDRAAVGRDVATTRSDWPTLGPTAGSARMPAATAWASTTALDRLGMAAAVQASVDTGEAANDASAATRGNPRP